MPGDYLFCTRRYPIYWVQLNKIDYMLRPAVEQNMAKPQRIRDPLHNLIEFGADPFEQTLWNVVKTRPFQRLRRIKQLGFSELVYPGATHTRFAHSLGVFHTARLLMQIIERHLGKEGFHQDKANQAIAAALVHDLGHGPFSHAFEKVGKRFGWDAANHEKLSIRLISEGEVAEALSECGSGFANDVASIVRKPSNVYGTVVSSQFDADRLDYMRRDRLMTGSQHSAIDFKWLIENLEIDSVPVGVDEIPMGSIETFVLGRKAVYAAEAYVLSLFQLYPTVYYHKATRSAEAMFTELLAHVFQLVLDGSFDDTGLSETNPIVRFARDPESIDNVIELDDTVIMGGLSMMANARNQFVSDMARRLRDRKLFKAIDVRQKAAAWANDRSLPDGLRSEAIERIHVGTKVEIEDAYKKDQSLRQRVMIDEGERPPYKKFDETKGPLNQIRIRVEGGEHVDLGVRSKVVKAIDPFKFFRVYVADEDAEMKSWVESLIKKETEKCHDN